MGICGEPVYRTHSNLVPVSYTAHFLVKKARLLKVFQQKSITLLVQSNRRLYLTDQIAMHKFINKIGQISMSQIFNIETKN